MPSSACKKKRSTAVRDVAKGRDRSVPKTVDGDAWNALHSHRLLFFFNDTATTEIYTLSLHDALPNSPASTTSVLANSPRSRRSAISAANDWSSQDRKSTRLNSSHTVISYAVFCL